MLEKEIEKKLVEGVRKIGGVAFKFTSPGNDGVPDREVCLPGGRIIFVELKTESGRLSGRQKVQIERLSQLGCDVRVLHGLGEVEKFLEEVKKHVDNYNRLAASMMGRK